jgi:hypothetical protein
MKGRAILAIRKGGGSGEAQPPVVEMMVTGRLGQKAIVTKLAVLSRWSAVHLVESVAVL